MASNHPLSITYKLENNIIRISAQVIKLIEQRASLCKLSVYECVLLGNVSKVSHSTYHLKIDRIESQSNAYDPDFLSIYENDILIPFKVYKTTSSEFAASDWTKEEISRCLRNFKMLLGNPSGHPIRIFDLIGLRGSALLVSAANQICPALTDQSASNQHNNRLCALRFDAIQPDVTLSLFKLERFGGNLVSTAAVAAENSHRFSLINTNSLIRSLLASPSPSLQTGDDEDGFAYGFVSFVDEEEKERLQCHFEADLKIFALPLAGIWVHSIDLFDARVWLTCIVYLLADWTKKCRKIDYFSSSSSFLLIHFDWFQNKPPVSGSVTGQQHCLRDYAIYRVDLAAPITNKKEFLGNPICHFNYRFLAAQSPPIRSGHGREAEFVASLTQITNAQRFVDFLGQSLHEIAAVITNETTNEQGDKEKKKQLEEEAEENEFEPRNRIELNSALIGRADSPPITVSLEEMLPRCQLDITTVEQPTQQQQQKYKKSRGGILKSSNQREGDREREVANVNANQSHDKSKRAAMRSASTNTEELLHREPIKLRNPEICANCGCHAKTTDNAVKPRVIEASTQTAPEPHAIVMTQSINNSEAAAPFSSSDLGCEDNGDAEQEDLTMNSREFSEIMSNLERHLERRAFLGGSQSVQLSSDAIGDASTSSFFCVKAHNETRETKESGATENGDGDQMVRDEAENNEEEMKEGSPNANSTRISLEHSAAEASEYRKVMAERKREGTGKEGIPNINDRSMMMANLARKYLEPRHAAPSEVSPSPSCDAFSSTRELHNYSLSLQNNKNNNRNNENDAHYKVSETELSFASRDYLTRFGLNFSRILSADEIPENPEEKEVCNLSGQSETPTILPQSPPPQQLEQPPQKQTKPERILNLQELRNLPKLL